MKPESRARLSTAFASGLASRGVERGVRAAKKDTAGELYIYDAIGGGFFSEGVTSKGVAEALGQLKGVSTLNIYINSPGGDVFEGVSIYNQIRRFDAKKVCHVDGIAASAASMIAMACDEIRMSHNAEMMIHDAWGMAVGNASDMRATADLLEKITEDAVLASYARTGQAKEQLRAWMSAETWMNAEEAQQRKFCDAVDGPDVEPAKASAAIPLFDLAAETQRRIRASSERMSDAETDRDARRIFHRFAASASRGGAPGQPGNQQQAPK